MYSQKTTWIETKKKNEYRSYLDNSIKIIHELNFD